jgi:hypothetical protein
MLRGIMSSILFLQGYLGLQFTVLFVSERGFSQYVVAIAVQGGLSEGDSMCKNNPVGSGFLKSKSGVVVPGQP